MGIKAILFDCDGVLVDSESLLMQSDITYFTELGARFSEDDYANMFLGSTFDQNLHIIQTKILSQLGENIPSMDEVEAEITHRRKQSLIDSLEPLTGAEDFVKMLEARGIKKATCSNTLQSEWLNAKMERAGLRKYFAPHIIAAGDVENGKPHPDMYLKGAADLGVEPEQCLVIEDSPTGAKAGIAAGMHTVGFAGASHIPTGHEDKLRAVGVDHICHSFAEFAEYLENLLDDGLKKAV